MAHALAGFHSAWHRGHVLLALIAQRATPTNLALAAAAPRGVDVRIVTPEQALDAVSAGDAALGRLDVVETLDGVDDGLWALGTLAAVLRGAAVVVTNDTGTSHLAAAVHAPSVIVHTVTDPERWAPLDRERHRPLRGDVEVRTVLGQVDELLTSPPAAAARSSDSGS